MRTVILASTVLAAASSALAASSTPCVIQGSSFGKFDISGLRKPKQDYVATNPDGGAISLNFCGAVSDQASPAESAQGYGAYIEDSRGGISLGEYTSTPAYHNGQLSLAYKNGAACPNSNARRSSLIHLVCDKSWTSDNKVTYVDNIDDCTYFFTMNTPYACPTSGGGFFGLVWSFIVFLFWTGVVVGGAYALYSRFFANKNGGGGYTLAGGQTSGSALGDAASYAKDIIIIGGIWVLDSAQNLFSTVKRRREANAAGAYDYNRGSAASNGPASYNNFAQQSQPLRAHSPSYREQQQNPDYNSEAWRATPPQPPAKSPTLHAPEPTNPALGGGGSLLEDDEDEDEATLAMPGTNGKNDSLV